MKGSHRARIATLVGAALAGIAVACWSAAADGDRAALAVLASVAGAAALCVGIALAMAARESPEPARAFALAWMSTSWLACALVCAGAVAAVPLGARWDERREASTLAWCERLVPRIRAFENQQRRLPLSLEELGDLQRPHGAFELRYRLLAGEFTLWFFSPEGGESESYPLTSGYNSKRDLWWRDDPDPSGTASLFYGVGTIDPW